MSILNTLAASSSSPYLISTTTTGEMAAIGVWEIIAAVLALVGGVLVYFLFVNAKAEPKGKFLKWLKDFLAFRTMWIEPVLKVFYYIVTIFVILFSFSLIAVDFLSFLGVLVLGPIIVRLGYEMMMMFIMIWRNTREIANNTKKQ